MSNQRMDTRITIISVGAFVGGLALMIIVNSIGGFLGGFLLSLVGVYIGFYYILVCKEAK